MKARYLVQLPTASEHRRWVDQRIAELAAADKCRKKRGAK